MRLSQFHLRTEKETPADAEVVSHQLMLRAGMLRKLAAGIYTWSPLGLRVLRKVEGVVRAEMNAAGALELQMPSIQPKELWEETGRWEKFGGQLLKIRDRKDADYCYGPTHEEVITDFARQELASYKQLPVNFYQIQTKFRDEIRPRFGAMRAREFLMKDAYSFHISDEDGPPQPCECPECKAADARYGGADVGQMLDFLNWLAERGRGVWPPGTVLETLAYAGYETPPPSGVIRDDVVIRFAPIHKCHWDKLDAAVNRRDLANLEGWLKLAKDVRIWDYPHQYGSGAEPVSSLAVTRRGDPGLRAWVQQAIEDPEISRAGLHLSLEGPVAPGERHVFTAGISAFWEPNRGVRPRLLVRWQRPRDRQPTLTSLTDSAAAIVCSEQADTAVQAVWEPGIQRAGGLELAGTWEQTEGLREWSYLRFDLSAIPTDARVLDAELVLSRVWVRGSDGQAQVAFRAVKPGTDWDPVRLTWNTQPRVEDRPLFSLRLPRPVPGYAGHDGLFPQPNLRVLVHNIRAYHELGARGVFMETDAPGLNSGIHCDADMTYWVLMQALWDPTRTADDLIDDFCRHYYGPAAEFITRYVARLEDAYARDPHRQAFHVGNYALQSFVDLHLISDCQRLFDQAEAACGGDGALLLRVRRARLSLDLLTLFNMDRLRREYRQRHHSTDGFPLDREAVERRYTESRLASVAERYPDRDLDTERKDISDLLSAARAAGDWTLWRTSLPPANDGHAR